MTRHSADERRVVARAADRQVYRWIREGEVYQQLRKEHDEPDLQACVRPYITISREAGTRTGQVAQLLGQRLGFQVLDKQLLEFMAERYQLPRHMLEVVDEKTANWMHEALAKLLDQQTVNQLEYVRHLGKIVLLAAQHGEAVIVGRGAQFMLPPASGLSVRIIGSKEVRIERTMAKHSLNRGEAKEFVDSTDRGRAELVRRYFDADIADPPPLRPGRQPGPLRPAAGRRPDHQRFSPPESDLEGSFDPANPGGRGTTHSGGHEFFALF